MAVHPAIIRANTAHRDAIVRFISALNREPEYQCLHCDTEPNGVAVEIDRLLAHEHIPLVAAFADGEPVGVLGCELNDAETNCWFRGPFVGDAQYNAMLAPMYNALVETLPPTITDLMAFPHIENTTSRAFYTGQEFTDTHTIHIYTAPPPAERPEADAGVREYNSELFDQLEALHNTAFANAVESAGDIVAKLDVDHRLFVLMENEELAGYIAVSIGDTPVEGFVDFLAVSPEKRGRRIGERLLTHAMHWFFAERAMPQAGLCVRDDRDNARRLYERVGFTLLASGVGMRRTIAQEQL